MILGPTNEREQALYDKGKKEGKRLVLNNVRKKLLEMGLDAKSIGDVLHDLKKE